MYYRVVGPAERHAGNAEFEGNIGELPVVTRLGSALMLDKKFAQFEQYRTEHYAVEKPEADGKKWWDVPIDVGNDNVVIFCNLAMFNSLFCNRLQT
jgi:hypothetical protein